MPKGATLSDILRKRIHECGLSHNELARAVKINQSQISRFANKTTSMTLENAEKLIRHFSIKVGCLLLLALSLSAASAKLTSCTYRLDLLTVPHRCLALWFSIRRPTKYSAVI